MFSTRTVIWRLAHEGTASQGSDDDATISLKYIQNNDALMGSLGWLHITGRHMGRLFLIIMNPIFCRDGLCFTGAYGREYPELTMRSQVLARCFIQSVASFDA